MKKMSRIAAVVFLLLFGVHARAEKDIEVKIQEEQILVVEFEKMRSNAFLSFRDHRGEILFKDSLSNNEPYRAALNLEVLPKGIYYLDIEKEFVIHSSIIVKNENGIVFQGDSSKTVFKPHIKVDVDQVLVFLSNPAKEKTRLEIYDSRGEIVGACADGKETFQKALDFSQVPRGEYTVKIENGNRTFFRKISIG